MNMLVLRGDQLLHAEGWLNQLDIQWHDTGNAMTPQEITDMSQDINLDALLNYRRSVGIGTQNIIKQLKQEDLYRKANPEDIKRLFDEGAVVEEARGVAEYWSSRDTAGLLLMPATRHILSHLNEATGIIKKVRKAEKK